MPVVAAAPRVAETVDEHVPRDELRPGVIDHMAFSASGLKATLAALDARRVEYVCRQQKGTGIWQVFVHDPNGAKVELDFPPDEPAPAR